MIISFSSLMFGINVSPKNSNMGANCSANVSARALNAAKPAIKAATPNKLLGVSPSPSNAAFNESNILP